MSVDAVRGLLVAGFALAVGLGHASIPPLIALAFSFTALQTLFDNAATALLPSLVRSEALGGANARLMTGQQLVGGLLAGPYAPAAVLVASLRTRSPERAPRPAGSTLRSEIAAGLRVPWRDRALRAVCVATTLCNVGMGALIATLALHVTRWLHAGGTGYVAAMTACSAGSLAGGFVASGSRAAPGGYGPCCSAGRCRPARCCSSARYGTCPP